MRLAYFGVGERATLAAAAVQSLMRPVTPAVLAEAQTALARDLKPQNDQQASAATRMHLARTLLARCVHDLTGQPAFPEARSA